MSLDFQPSKLSLRLSPARLSCWGFALCVFLLLAGCLAPSQNVYIDAYLDPNREGPLLPGGSFFITIDPKAANPLLEKEVAAKFTTLLNSKAYWPASEQAAEIILTFSLSQKSEMVSAEEPIYTPDRQVPVTTRDSQGKETTQVVTVPGETRYRTVVRKVFQRKLGIKAYEGQAWRKGERNQAVIWVGEASSESRDHDLRGAVDYLLAAAFSSFGQDTGGSLRINISAQDPAMQLLKGPDRP